MGEVKNSGGNVTIIAQGEEAALENFFQRLSALFEIKKYNEKTVACTDYDNFSITQSTHDGNVPFITPDLATCAQCEAELTQTGNRRRHHPFISCINCGPRYTIIDKLPYDRENTVMHNFPMCGACEKEYTHAENRRCHAQTIACNECGPVTNISIDDAVSILDQNKILAIKDIGGYHLACRPADNAVNRLRELKGREKKPFAVMFRCIEEIKEYCIVTQQEKALITSTARPIVLLKKKKDLPHSVCADSDYIGAFLPCNPIQIMILNKVSPLVMTSANVSGEPIITDDDEIHKFGVDVLSHNRRILTPIDDSVLQINNGKVQFIRRARGYVPLAIKIDRSSDEDMLCMGGDLKSAFAIVHKEYVYPSQYFGDLEDTRCLEAYEKCIARMCRLHSVTPKKIVCDMHPGYYSSTRITPDIHVQHHLAHAYSVIAEHEIKGDVLSFVFDGTGYGDDGAIWGGEVFLNKKRVCHLDYVPMPASDEISKNAALALDCYLGSNPVLNKAIENNINTVNSSSMGRLFDAVCALLEIKQYNSYEGECAVALESAAGRADKPYRLTPTWNPRQTIKEIAAAKPAESAESLALGFHQMLGELILLTAKQFDVRQIVLSGGCFVNRLLMGTACSLLENNGFTVYTNEKVSCGDNGISLGQAYLAIKEA